MTGDDMWVEVDDETRTELERIAAEEGRGTTLEDIAAAALREFIARNATGLPDRPAGSAQPLPGRALRQQDETEGKSRQAGRKTP